MKIYECVATGFCAVALLLFAVSCIKKPKPSTEKSKAKTAAFCGKQIPLTATSIHCHSASMKTLNLAMLANFPQVQRLSVYAHRVTSTASITRLKQLRKLTLIVGSFSRGQPLGSSTLQQLTLGTYGSLDDLVFGGFQNLSSIDLRRYHRGNLAVLAGLPKLRTLKLQAYTAELQGIGKLQELTELGLVFELPNVPAGSTIDLGKLTKLRALRISGGKSVHPTGLGKLESLRTLELDLHAGPYLQKIATLSGLESLLLGISNLPSDRTLSLKTLKQLKHLNLRKSEPDLTFDLRGMSSLESLSSSNSQLVDGLISIKNSKLLRRLDLTVSVDSASALSLLRHFPGLSDLRVAGVVKNLHGSRWPLAQLRRLEIRAGAGSELGFLAAAKNLSWLKIEPRDARDLTSLPRLPQLKALEIKLRSPRTVHARTTLDTRLLIARTPNLTALALRVAKLENCSQLRRLLTLTRLRLVTDHEATLACVSKVVQLKRLTIQIRRKSLAIKDGLPALKMLTHLSLTGPWLAGLKPDSIPTGISVLELRGNPPSMTGFVRRLPRLRLVSFGAPGKSMAGAPYHLPEFDCSYFKARPFFIKWSSTPWRPGYSCRRLVRKR